MSFGAKIAAGVATGSAAMMHKAHGLVSEAKELEDQRRAACQQIRDNKLSLRAVKPSKGEDVWVTAPYGNRYGREVQPGSCVAILSDQKSVVTEAGGSASRVVTFVNAYQRNGLPVEKSVEQLQGVEDFWRKEEVDSGGLGFHEMEKASRFHLNRRGCDEAQYYSQVVKILWNMSVGNKIDVDFPGLFAYGPDPQGPSIQSDGGIGLLVPSAWEEKLPPRLVEVGLKGDQGLVERNEYASPLLTPRGSCYVPMSWTRRDLDRKVGGVFWNCLHDNLFSFSRRFYSAKRDTDGNPLPEAKLEKNPNAQVGQVSWEHIRGLVFQELNKHAAKESLWRIKQPEPVERFDPLPRWSRLEPGDIEDLKKAACVVHKAGSWEKLMALKSLSCLEAMVTMRKLVADSLRRG